MWHSVLMASRVPRVIQSSPSDKAAISPRPSCESARYKHTHTQALTRTHTHVHTRIRKHTYTTTCHIQKSAMTNSQRSGHVLVYGTWLDHMSDMSHSSVRQESLIFVTWRDHLWNINQLFAWHGAFICAYMYRNIQTHTYTHTYIYI